jgi:two-component system phosphate regulon response regulator PhoB
MLFFSLNNDFQAGGTGDGLSAKKDRKIILVVDDDLDSGIFLSTIIRSRDFRPVIAGDLSEGLRKVAAERPALIILDWMSKKEEGLLFYSYLKNHQTYNNIPFIMVSKLDNKVFRHYQKIQTAKTGQDLPEPEAYLKKPPEAEELLNLLENLIFQKET